MHMDTMGLLIPPINATKHSVDGIPGLEEVILTHVLDGTFHIASEVLTVRLVLCRLRRVFNKLSQKFCGDRQALRNTAVIGSLQGFYNQQRFE